MAFETLSGGIGISIPTTGTKNWGAQAKQLAWKPINDHRHTGAGDGNALLEASYSDYSVTKSKLGKNMGSFQQTTLSPVGTTQTVDFNLGSKVVLDVSGASGNVTVTLSNPLAGGQYRIKLVQGATPRTIVWPASVKWGGGVEPTQFSDASLFSLIDLDYDGTNYIANHEMNIA